MSRRHRRQRVDLGGFEAIKIGGPGAFALPCLDYDGFAEAMRRKLLREIS